MQPWLLSYIEESDINTRQRTDVQFGTIKVNCVNIKITLKLKEASSYYVEGNMNYTQ